MEYNGSNQFMSVKAIQFAAEKHKLQREKEQRKGTGESFITHPLGVLDIFIKTDISILIAAVLHDTVSKIRIPPLKKQKIYSDIECPDIECPEVCEGSN